MARQAVILAIAALAACGGGAGDDDDDVVACDAITLAADPVAHVLPGGYVAAAFPALATTASCGADGTPSYVTLDLTGDGALDLAVTRVCGDAAVGTDHWLVYPGGDGGFADDPISWSLPAGFIAGAFTATAAANACGADGTASYTTTDLTGDGTPDLVVTRRCGDATVGDSRWQVHAGGAAGFAASGADWALPGGYVAGAFTATGANNACGAAGTASYALADLDGDDQLDLVVTRACGDATVGDTRWRLHAGGSSGFAGAPAAWALPTGYVTNAFVATAAVNACGADATASYALADLDGDGRVELVVTRVCGDAAVGDGHWRRYAAGGSGFSGEADWTLPDGYPAGSFAALGLVAACGAADTPAYATLDVDGDDLPDLLITRICGDSTVGDARWIVHRGTAAGFGTAGDVPLPTGYAAGAFELPSSQAACGVDGTPSYGLAPLGGRGRPDLVITRLCGDDAIGDQRWLVHRNLCRP